MLSVFCFLLSSASAAATRYVWQKSPSPAPYTNLATAAHAIQDAVAAAQTDAAVLVAGGVYATGGRAVGTNLLVNRVAIDRAITVESLRCPEVTIIQGCQVTVTTKGDGAIRCAYLTYGASLAGFTLTHGATRTNGVYSLDQSGGRVRCESTNTFVTNCVLSGNSVGHGGARTCEPVRPSRCWLRTFPAKSARRLSRTPTSRLCRRCSTAWVCDHRTPQKHDHEIIPRIP